MRVLANDIHNPLGNNDHLADSVAAQGLFYRIKSQNGSLNFRILGMAGHRDLTPFLAVDLNHQRHRILNQQIAFDFRPIGLRNQTRLAQHLPALLRQMRHHGREQLNQDDGGLTNRPRHIGTRIRRRFARTPQHLAQRIGEFPDIGQADVEMQLFDAGGDLVQRAMGRLA